MTDASSTPGPQGRAESPFAFLATLPRDEARDWLREFLQGREPPPRVGRHDARPAADLVSSLRAPQAASLRPSVARLGAGLLAEAIEQGLFQSDDPAAAGYVAALLAVLESLPDRSEGGPLLQRLVVSGLLRGRSSERGDLHLLALRALVSNQPGEPQQRARWTEAWRLDLSERQCGPIAFQGLLRVDREAALAELPVALAGWVRADPGFVPYGIAYLLESAVGEDALAWAGLARGLAGQPGALPAFTAAARESQWEARLPAAWQALTLATGQADPTASNGISFNSRWVSEEDRSRVRRGRGDPALGGPLLRAA